jgi:hypothetical protein
MTFLALWWLLFIVVCWLASVAGSGAAGIEITGNVSPPLQHLIENLDVGKLLLTALPVLWTAQFLAAFMTLSGRLIGKEPGFPFYRAFSCYWLGSFLAAFSCFMAISIWLSHGPLPSLVAKGLFILLVIALLVAAGLNARALWRGPRRGADLSRRETGLAIASILVALLLLRVLVDPIMPAADGSTPAAPGQAQGRHD